MSAATAKGGIEGSSQRCAVCDADVLFLSVCPACGSPTGNATAAAAPGAVAASVAAPAAAAAAAGPGARMGQMVSFADAARARNKTALPDELIKAWQPVPPVRHPRRDEFVAASSSSRWRGGSRRSRILAAAAAIVVAAAAVGVQLSHGTVAPPGHDALTHGTAPAARSTHASGSGPAMSRYEAAGMPFSAAFPSAASMSRQHLRLLHLPYVATSYTSISAGTMVSVGVYPLPIRFGARVPLGTFVRSFLRLSGVVPPGSKVSAGHMTKLQGLDSVMVAGTADGGLSATFGAIVLDGHIVYEVLATGPATSVDQTFQKFLARFRIADPALGWTF